MNPTPHGLALPMALLLLVILTLLASAAFSVAQDGLRRGEWELRWFLSQRVIPSEARWSDLDWISLGGGFHLVRGSTASGSSGPVPQRILWCLDPALEALRESFSDRVMAAPALGPLGLRDLAGTLTGAFTGAQGDSTDLQLSSNGADDFLVEVRVSDDVRLAIGQGLVNLPEVEPWSGLLILHGGITGGKPGSVKGGLWHWGAPLPLGLRVENHPEIRERALRALPSCPEPLFHVADLGRR